MGRQTGASANEPVPLVCDGVIVATRAPQAAALLAGVDAELAAQLSQIEYAGTAILSLAYRRDQIGNALDGFGFVVPAAENRRILAGSFSSLKFAGRAPESMVLVRVFIGGACQSELLQQSDDQLRAIAIEELGQLLDIRGEPALADVTRWPHSMPQYHLGHGERVATIERLTRRWEGLALAGNAYHGVGIPNCIHSGETAAEQMVELLCRSAPHAESR